MTLYERYYQIDYFSGWRYLFSEKFRKQSKRKWGRNRLLKSLFIIGSLIGMLLTSAAAVLLLQFSLYMTN
jgi:uncharacterized membrane protein YoaK (UPF0700 family)